MEIIMTVNTNGPIDPETARISAQTGQDPQELAAERLAETERHLARLHADPFDGPHRRPVNAITGDWYRDRH
jgi:hypothetical protein